MNVEKQWLSAHIFYHEEHDRLITEAISPLLEKLMGNKWIKKYFFIRYWEGGPHIRLRVLVSGDQVKGVKSIIEKDLGTYLLKSPAKKSIDKSTLMILMKPYQNFESKTQESIKVYPNNSIEFIEYIPEYDRYGGKTGIEFAEYFFHYSSEFNIELLKKLKSSKKDRKIIALRMMLLAALAWEIKPHEIARMMQNYSLYWARF